jgi:pimeloyl-ACP methyl ester carboxylesterase
MPHFTLPDGRTLDYSIDGAKDGFPFVFIHGTPGSVNSTLPSLKHLCKQKGLKIISMSRAGYGDSTRHAGRRVIDNVADVQALLEHLGVETCVAGGWSGGGPHVLALAAKLPGVKAALCVAGVAPADAEGLDFLAGQGQDSKHDHDP